MDKKVIYGVFAMKIELPEISNKIQELQNIANAMQNYDGVKTESYFVRAYETMEAAVSECMYCNGCLIERTIDSPDGVMNGKDVSYYFPKAIEVLDK
jgi:hypothetical protein